jgi:hypothetical protein
MDHSEVSVTDEQLSNTSPELASDERSRCFADTSRRRVLSAPSNTLDSYRCLAFDGDPGPTQAGMPLASEDETGYDTFWSDEIDLVFEGLETFEALD